MMLGSVILAMGLGAAASGFLYVKDAPLWQVIAAYPLTGVVTLFLALAAAWRRPASQSDDEARVQAHWPVPRTTTPTVAASTLRSVQRDRFRA